MPLPDNFESLWNQGASEESFQTLMGDLRSWISEHWQEEQKSIEKVLLRLLERGPVAGTKHVLKAVRAPFPLNVSNGELIQQVVRYLDDPSLEIRIEAIHILGRLASEHDNAPGLYLTHLMAMLKTETDVSCRGRLLVYAEKAICDAQTRLAKVCLGETADKKLGPWREMSVLGHLQKLRVKWHDWQAFFDKLIAEMESWDRLGWIAFRTLIKSVSFDSSLYRELVERIPELIRIVEVVEYRLELDTNILNRHALIQLIGPMSRRRKRKIVNENIGFLAKAIKYDYPGICRECLEIFLELSTVPLLSSEQRTNLLTHKDDHVRELAEELFEPVFATV
jgi:hypothetical protein